MPDEAPKTLDYSSPPPEQAPSKLDPLAAVALTVGALSMVIALFPSGMPYEYMVGAGIFGGLLALLLAIAALTRLLAARPSAASNIVAAASALACAALALWSGLRIYLR